MNFQKLQKIRWNRFIGYITITCKNDKSINQALDSKLRNKHYYKNKYRMPINHMLLDGVAIKWSQKPVGDVWFTKLDLNNAYS